MDELIYRQEAVGVLNDGAELWRRVLDEPDVVGIERKKYEWGLGLIESYISDMKELSTAQDDLIAKIQNGIKLTDANDSYSCGMRNGMRWCMSLIDDKDPLFEWCPSVESKQSLITDEQAIEHLQSTGWMQNHDKEMFENCGASNSRHK